jgi:hypothetical protein
LNVINNIKPASSPLASSGGSSGGSSSGGGGGGGSGDVVQGMLDVRAPLPYSCECALQPPQLKETSKFSRGGGGVRKEIGQGTSNRRSSRRMALKTLNRRFGPTDSATWSGLKAPRPNSLQNQRKKCSRPSKLAWSSVAEQPAVAVEKGVAAAVASGLGPKQPSPLDALKPLLLEIEPPFGVLRPQLVPEMSFNAVQRWVEDSLQLLQTDLPTAARALGMSTCGLTFQACLKRASAEGSATLTTGGAMYADRDDRAAGATIDLDQMDGGAAAASDLSARCSKLVGLLRIKLEDDGDLGQVRALL